MFAIRIDPNWYDDYWFGDRPRGRRRSMSEKMALLAAIVMLLAGGGLELDY